MDRVCVYINLLLILGAARSFGTVGPSLSPYQSYPDSSLVAETSQWLGEPPAWAQQRRSDYQLDFSKADAAVLQQQQRAAVSFRGLPLNITHQQGYYYGNIAIVRIGSQFYVAVRKLQFYFTLRTALPEYPIDKDPGKKFISWWVSRISICTADEETLQPQSCSDFDPRSWRNHECMWSGGFESLGPEDPRLILWPGKGLYIMFISKPWAIDPAGATPSQTRCAGPWAQQPWLMPLVTYQVPATASGGRLASSGTNDSRGGSQELDPWLKPELLRLQYMPGHHEGGSDHHEGGSDHQDKADSIGNRTRRRTTSKRLKHHLHKEKNWNAFIYHDELYFSQNFDPHVVMKPAPNGTCSKVYQSESPSLKSLPAKPKGNTQAILLAAAVTGEPEDVYMGIVHVEVDRSYTNYFYKMQAHPPFQITAVSSPIPLIPGTHPRVPKWKHISFPMSIQLLEETQQLMIGYGSGDQASRVMFMGLEDALKLFQGQDGGLPKNGTG